MSDMKKELYVIGQITKQLDKLTPSAAERVLSYVNQQLWDKRKENAAANVNELRGLQEKSNLAQQRPATVTNGHAPGSVLDSVHGATAQ